MMPPLQVHDQALTEAIQDLTQAINICCVSLHADFQALIAAINGIGLILPTALAITQKETSMITGVPVGGSGTFVESFVPSNAALPTGTVMTVTWTVDDPLVTLAPSSDGTQVVASVAATDTATSFNLTATGAIAPPLSNGTTSITSGPVNVPILPAPPPLPTALAVNQTA